MSNSDEMSVKQEAEQRSPSPDPIPTKQSRLAFLYRKTSMWLLIFYVPLLLIPWILTCVLSGHPGDSQDTARQYLPQSGLMPNGVLSILSWVAAIRTLGSIAGVATIPVMSALLGQAAVVYTQRRKQGQELSMRQTFTLADRRWSDITVLYDAFKNRGSARPASRFLWLAMALILLSAAQHPVQNLLVTWQSVPVVTCLDDPTSLCHPLAYPTTVVAYDPEPASMELLPQNSIVQEVMSGLTTFSVYHFEPRLWADPSYLDTDGTLSDPVSRQMPFFWLEHMQAPNFFVSSAPNGTETGVLREHAIRLNSSVSCELIPKHKFPTPCPGPRPFHTSLSNRLMDVRICVPGEYGVTPWSLSRNRQDISEELFIDFEDRTPGLKSYVSKPFTIQCKASTSRGYFELGNYRNGQTYGPLLEKWPSPEEMKRDFNDYLSLEFANSNTPPTESDEFENGDLSYNYPSIPDPFGTYKHNASGPLMSSAIAMFGNQSFFYVAANSSSETYPPPDVQICQSGNIPFSSFSSIDFSHFQGRCYDVGVPQGNYGYDPIEDITALLGSWFYGFYDPDQAETALTVGMYLSNRATLTQAVSSSLPFGNRGIYFGPGVLVPLPFKTFAGTIIVSVFIFLQLLGLAFLTYYIYHVPTWTHALNALSVARIGATMNRSGELLDLDDGTKVDERDLADVNGLVGLRDDDGASTADARIQLGGPGFVSRKQAGNKGSKTESSYSAA